MIDGGLRAPFIVRRERGCSAILRALRRGDKLMIRLLVLAMLMTPSVAEEQHSPEGARLLFQDLRVGEQIWTRTYITPLDAESPAATDKVYCDLFGFDGKTRLTTGAAERFPHHKGLFVGWRDVGTGDATYDFWHMKACQQEHVEWLEITMGQDRATQWERIAWRTRDGKEIIREIRGIQLHRAGAGRHVADVVSELRSAGGPVSLRGDAHHAGIQVRVTEAAEGGDGRMKYVLPETAVTGKDDVVEGAWWACGAFMLDGRHYWLLHMTAPGLSGLPPQYSLRGYGRFGSYYALELGESDVKQYRCRLVLSESALGRLECEQLYRAYAENWQW